MTSNSNGARAAGKNKGGRGNVIDLKDRPFGVLTVIRRATRDEILSLRSNNIRSARWVCKCQCGTHRIVLGSNLTNGKTRSCNSSACRQTNKYAAS
jgi:hypothetical protein